MIFQIKTEGEIDYQFNVFQIIINFHDERERESIENKPTTVAFDQLNHIAYK